jgi:hypothetical protein
VQGKGIQHGKGKRKVTEDGKGRGREMVKGKVLLNKPQGEMISLVRLLCSSRRKCMRQTWTRRANFAGGFTAESISSNVNFLR